MLAPLDIFDPSSYPTRRDEEWKYSDLSRVLREAPAPFRPVEIADYEPEEGPFESIAVVNGGSSITSHKFANLADRVGVSFVGHSMKEGILGHQGEATIDVPEGKSLVLFETYSNWQIWHDGVCVENDERPYVGNTTLRITLGEGASLTRVVILDESAEAVSIRRSTVRTAPNSRFKQYVFSTGAKFQRFETHVAHAGHGAEVELNGAYLLKDKRHFDLTTRVTHAEVDGITSQLIKGLVKDTATGVFQGRILVKRGADGTDARMRHQALILNDGAHIRAKPELEIYADDVQCAHGNTIGALDEEALFFCESRGIPEDAARALLTQAFVMPVADLIEDEQLRETVIEFLDKHTEAFHGL